MGISNPNPLKLPQQAIFPLICGRNILTDQRLGSHQTPVLIRDTVVARY